MTLKSSSEICKAYGNEIGVSDPITVFIDIETDECIGYYVETDFNQVLFVHKERDYKKFGINFLMRLDWVVVKTPPMIKVLLDM